MKTSKQMLAAVFLSLTFLGGCSMNDKGTTGNDMSNSNVGKDIRNAVEDSGQAVQDSIDNVMDFFTQKNIKYENMQTLDNMEFAAHEGRSFTIDGKNAYLYRVKEDDENMKKIMEQARNNGKVKVSITGKEMEYNARVNGNYLFLYDPSAKIDEALNAFDAYRYDATNNMSGNNNHDNMTKDTNGNTDSSMSNQ